MVQLSSECFRRVKLERLPGSTFVVTLRLKTVAVSFLRNLDFIALRRVRNVKGISGLRRKSACVYSFS